MPAQQAPPQAKPIALPFLFSRPHKLFGKNKMATLFKPHPMQRARQWWRDYVARPLNAEERKIASRGYAVAASVFVRPSLEQNLRPSERKRLVNKMLSRTYLFNKHVSNEATQKKLNRAILAGGLVGGGLGAFLAKKAMQAGFASGASIGAAIAAKSLPFFVKRISLNSLSNHDSYTHTIKYPARNFKIASYPPLPERERLNILRKFNVLIAVHEAVHFIEDEPGLGMQNDLLLAQAADTVFNKLRTNAAPGKKAPPEDFQETASENYEAGERIGNTAIGLARKVGFKKAAWDYLYLLSRGMHPKAAENTIRRIYAETAKAKSAAQGEARK